MRISLGLGMIACIKLNTKSNMTSKDAINTLMPLFNGFIYSSHHHTHSDTKHKNTSMKRLNLIL